MLKERQIMKRGGKRETKVSIKNKGAKGIAAVQVNAVSWRESGLKQLFLIQGRFARGKGFQPCGAYILYTETNQRVPLPHPHLLSSSFASLFFFYQRPTTTVLPWATRHTYTHVASNPAAKIRYASFHHLTSSCVQEDYLGRPSPRVAFVRSQWIDSSESSLIRDKRGGEGDAARRAKSLSSIWTLTENHWRLSKSITSLLRLYHLNADAVLLTLLGRNRVRTVH